MYIYTITIIYTSIVDVRLEWEEGRNFTVTL